MDFRLSSFLENWKSTNSQNCQVLNEKGGYVLYIEEFFTKNEAEILTKKLENEVCWQQGEIMLYGKKIKIPRLQAWVAENGLTYTYSGVELKPDPWVGAMESIRQSMQKKCGLSFNSALLNLYRDGKDSVSWHSDDEKELGKNPIIALLSFGDSRRFDLRHKENESLEDLKIQLVSGSLLIMAGSLQHYWKHQVAKTSQDRQARISMTLRNIL